MKESIWEDHPWPPLDTLAGELTTDVCVIGLGGSGLMAIDELNAGGAAVIGLDAGSVGGGAAGRNAGFLLAGLADFLPTMLARFGESLAVALYRETVEEVDRVHRRFPGQASRTGILRLAADSAEGRDCAEHLRLLQHHGFPAEGHAGPDGEGLLVPSDGVFQPLHFVRTQALDLVARGSRLFEQTAVTGIAPGRVTTPGGRITCRAIIVAVDGGLEELLPELKPRARTARLQMLATAPAPDAAISRPVYWRDGFEYWQKLPGGNVVLGGFRDAGGAAEWTTDREPSAPVQHRLEHFLREHLQIKAPVTHRWAASVSYTEDRLPVLEEVRPGVIVTGAYSGTGNIVGRLGGRAAAQLALGRKSKWADLLVAARDAASAKSD